MIEVNQKTLDAAFASGRIRYPNDCIKIQNVAASIGLVITNLQAQEIWGSYSDLYCAGWLVVLSDEAIKSAIRRFIEQRLGQ